MLRRSAGVVAGPLRRGDGARRARVPVSFKLGQDKAVHRGDGGGRRMFRSAGLRFTAAWFALWLADGYLRAGQASSLVPIAKEVLDTSREDGLR